MSDASDLRELYTRELEARGFQSDPAQLAVVAKLAALRERLLAPRRRRWLGRLVRGAAPHPLPGLYLWGPVGRGKTFLVDLFFESLPFPERRRRHFHRFMHDLHTGLAQLPDEREPLALLAASIAREARVLCFDELQVTDIADAMILGALFEALFRHGVTLVVTSNSPPRELYRDGLQRQRFLPAIALLERHLEVHRLGGTTDYRLRSLSEAGVYLPAGAPGTRARLEALFGALAPHGARRGGELRIAGRSIALVAAAPAVVWFDFTALCAGPRSPEDYLEIAREYRAVIVSDVPVLDAAADDAARRFIALIDELYDRNVTLIASAAAPPPELYRGERLQRPFERTASRLVEMQSREYLGREHKP
ncbi:MAG TPA: cell division protein ZapE [Steroidobacteraceae bacterium]|nr:cell division protein ZapE [Steroidobacteraceae bacterium]